MPGLFEFLAVGLCQNQVLGAFAAVTASLYVESHLLAVFQTGQAGTLDCRDVDEYVLASAFGLDKAETFSCVEPFHGAIGHRDIS